MERIINQRHDRNTLLIASSRLFERAAYYGIRSIMILYLIKESIVEEEATVLEIYGWFVGSIVLTRIIGAVVGDLIIGNRWAVIIGGILQTIGALLFCVGNLYSVYIGLALVTLGAGFCIPNIEAHYGKLYLDRKKLLDAAYVILSIAVNLGAFLGTVFIAWTAEDVSWNVAFVIAACVSFVSILLFILTKKQLPSSVESKVNFSKFVIPIVVLVTSVSLIWIATAISEVKHSAFQIPETMSIYWDYLLPNSAAVFMLPIGIIAIIFWTKYYRNPYIKILIGIFFALLAYSLLYFIPEEFSESTIPLYLIAMFFLSISGMYLEPVLKSLLVRHSNPKYLAIIFSLAFVPGYYLANNLAFSGDLFIENSQLGIIISIIVSALLLCLVFFGLYKRNKEFE